MSMSTGEKNLLEAEKQSLIDDFNADADPNKKRHTDSSINTV
jgi:hypothetical protein